MTGISCRRETDRKGQNVKGMMARGSSIDLKILKQLIYMGYKDVHEMV